MPVDSATRVGAMGLAVLMVVAAACGSAAEPLPAAGWVAPRGTVPPSTDPPTLVPEAPGDELASGVLVQDEAGSVYDIAHGDGTLKVAGGAVDGNNTRIVVWSPAQPPSADQMACATWRTQTDGVNQQGVALRIRRDGDRTRALVVTKNVSYGITSAFNVHAWDSASPRPFDGPPGNQFWLRALDRQPLPWRMCARVRGMQVQFSVWPLRAPERLEPDWDDPQHGAALTLGPEWSAWAEPGRAGWYAGHLFGGHEVVYDQLVPPPG